MQIYIHKNNQQIGPFTEDEVKAKLASGEISLLDPVWWQGQADWVPLGQSPLAATLTATTPGPIASTAPFTQPPVPTPGTPSAQAYVPQVESTSGLAIASLVCSFVLCCLSIPAVVLGHIALVQMKKNPLLKGRGLAIAGLIIGYIGIVLLICWFAMSFLVALGSKVKMKELEEQIKSAESTDSTPSNDDSK